jgi:hypothetical protein
MRYRVAVEFPHTVEVGLGTYILDLVEGDNRDGCWLRVQERDEPVVFLLAHFASRTAALAALDRGVEFSDQPFSRHLLQSLTETGVAERVVRAARQPSRANHTWSPLEVPAGLQLASV